MGGILADAEAGTGHAGAQHREEPLPAELARQVAIVAEAIAPGVDDGVLTRALIAWTQLFGMISFELFGQFVGALEPADPFFGYTVERMADYVGLR
jgi:hypothetical protein